MPKPPLIISERARAAVIAALMLVILIASLGLAYGLVVLPAPERYDLTLGDRQRVGDLTLAVPQGWRQTDLGSGFKEFETAVRFSDRHDATRQMIVGSLVLNKPSAPLSVLQYLLGTMLGRSNPRDFINGPAIHELQVGNMVGLRYTDATQTAEGVLERFIAVMTADGRRQWVIILSQPIETKSIVQKRILTDDAAFEKICESVVLLGLPRAATQKNEEQP